MTRVSDPHTIRLAPAMRGALILWFSALGVLCAAIGGVAIAHGSIAGALVAAAFLGLGATVCWRWSSLAVKASDDQLIIRQLLTTRTISRRDLSSFRVGGRASETPGVAVRAVLRDGTTVVLAATGYYFRSRRDVEMSCATLERWREGGILHQPR